MADEEIILTDQDEAVIAELEGDEIEENDIGGSEPISEDETSEVAEDIADDFSLSDQTFNPDLINRAEVYGFNPDDFQNETALRRVVEGFDQGNAMLDQYQQWSYQSQQQAVPQSGEEQIPPGNNTLAPFQVNLGDEYDEDFKAAINGLASQMHSQYSENFDVLARTLLDQQGVIDQYQSVRASEQAQAEIDHFDYLVGEVGNSDLFGDSSYMELDPSSSEAQNRERLFTQMEVMANSFAQMGQPVPPDDQLIDQAYRSVFGNEIDDQNRRSFNDKMRKASSRRLGGGGSTKQVAAESDPNDIVNDAALKDVFDGYLRENGEL